MKEPLKNQEEQLLIMVFQFRFIKIMIYLFLLWFSKEFALIFQV